MGPDTLSLTSSAHPPGLVISLTPPPYCLRRNFEMKAEEDKIHWGTSRNEKFVITLLKLQKAVGIKAVVKGFGKYAYSLSCLKLDDKINTTLISVL